MNVFVELERRQRAGRPIRIAVIGTGFFGGGLVRRIARIQGLVPAAAANRTLDRAVAALVAAGVERSAIRLCDDLTTAQAALDDGCYVATSSLRLPAYLEGIDVVMEATGDVLVGTEIALEAIRHHKHIVAANIEVQATVGPILKSMADDAGVVYSDVAGDEPGILKTLFDFCTGLGFTPVVASNCKGVLKRYATPASQAAFAQAHGLQPWVASAAADGTKLNLEMAAVANATGMPPAVPGMTGVQTTLETVLDDLERHGLLSQGPIVEYTLGIPNGVLLVVHSDDPYVRREFHYLKMGAGPHYVFHHPHVLVHYEAPLSAAAAALYQEATIAPRGAPTAEVASYAKRELKAGERLDGIGGFHCYGLITPAVQAHAEGMLPIGLADYARLTHDIAKDGPITRDAVVFEEDNLAIDLRRQQDALFAHPAHPAHPSR
jgi:predicted homoserine dehydrogenase-like protein